MNGTEYFNWYDANFNKLWPTWLNNEEMFANVRFNEWCYAKWLKLGKKRRKND